MDLLAWVSHGAERMVQSHRRRIGITAGRASALLSWGQSLDDNERHETGEDLAAEAILRPMPFVYFSESCNLQLAGPAGPRYGPSIHQRTIFDIDRQLVRMSLPRL
jgi:hypothetical protein